MRRKLLHIFVLLGLLASCGKEEEKTVPVVEAEKPTLELRKADFSELKNWSKDKTEEAYHTFQLSCDKIKNLKKEYIAEAQIKIPAKDYQDICQKFAKIKDNEFKKFLEQNMTPYLVTYEGNEVGKFTSYYESALQASHNKSDKYRFPIYGKPLDLIEFNPQDFDKSLPAKRLLGRVEKQKLIPYYTRDEIVRQGVNAPVVLWASSYVDIYVMQIQGSAVAELDDGQKVRIGFADTNGREFRGIGSILLEKGLIKPGQASMGKIKKWLEENGELAIGPMNENQRYIFHRLIEADGPIGAQGVPLTAGRSLAVDRSFVPLGSLLWLETTGPNLEKIEKLVVAQDIGGAIKGAVRGDYFWGSGGDEILEMAGKMNAQGRYFILLPKTIEVKNEP